MDKSILIKNGTIVDGTNKERFKGDVRIEGDKIKGVGNLKSKNGELIIDARNQFVSPGFVDILNRSDIHLSIFQRPMLGNLLKQGITTILGGGCGSSLAPLAGVGAIRSIQKWQDISALNINWSSMGEFLDEVERHDISLNFATLTGHATMRRGIAGDSFERLTEADMKKMEYLLEKSMDEGSFGLSTGLAYSHAKIAPREELDRLAKVAKHKKGFYATHLRNEGSDLVVSVNETIAIARDNNIPSHIYHFKAVGEGSWGEFHKALEMLSYSRDHGESITFDVYPYTKTASVLYLLLPDWVSRGGKKEVLRKLRDNSIRERIWKELADKSDDIAKMIVAFGSVDPTFIGKTIGDIAQNQDVSVVGALINLIIASDDRIIGFMTTIDERNVELGIESEFGFVSSDGAGYTLNDSVWGNLVHPRSFGAFPRFLARYVRGKGILSWESAIHKITSQPAEKIGLNKRGKIKKGYFADIVIFDPQKINDKATFRDPFQYSTGVNYVFVNGGLALRMGKFQKKRWGRVLRKE